MSKVGLTVICASIVIFVRTAQNYADQFTKNVTGDIYDAHIKSFLGTKESI